MIYLSFLTIFIATLNSNFIKRLLIFIIFLAGFSLLSMGEAAAQAKMRVMQVSGVVLGEDSINGLPGVHLYVPKAGRGTTTNRYGYFSMPVLANDSLVISSIGYESQSFIIPGDKGENFTIIIQMVTDTTYLPPIEVFPFPTEELFKEAILAMKLPNQYDLDNMQRNLGDEILAKIYQNTPMDAQMNYNLYMQQQFMHQHTRYGQTMIPFLNPANWAQFIQSIKRGDYRRQ